MEANPNAKSQRALKICQKWQELSSELSTWRTRWQEIADLMNVRKGGISSFSETPNVDRETMLFDTTAGDALMTMAGGLMSWTTPANEQWFNFQPIFRLRQSDAVKQWLQDCSMRTLEVLANSAFYTERHEDLLNHCSFGTSALYCGLEGGRLRFESLSVGSYAIEENAFGEVDTLYRLMKMNARQAIQMFGEDKVSEKIQKAAKEEKAVYFDFVHAVYPRPESERPEGVGRLADWGKPFASCYVDLCEKMLVKESGFDSFPFACGRFLRWTALGMRTPYGYGPGFESLPDVRQVNFLQMMQDAAAEKIVRPSMIAPEEMEQRLILSPGGVTYMPANVAADRWPKAVQQVGDYSVGVERIKAKQESIRAKFHHGLFNLFATLERPQMTATEVAARESEKIMLISPAFSRLISEKDTPMLRRLFSLCAEAGIYDPPPPEAIEQMSGYSATVPTPDVDYTSRLALAVKQLANMGLNRQLQQSMMIAQFDPSILDHYDWAVITRDSARNNGVPAGWLRAAQDVAAMQQQRAQAQAAQAGMQAAETASKAVKNIGGPDKAAELLGQ